MALRRVAVAASGGRDSTALLHCAARQAQALGLEVVALHVHHGLMPEADAWLQQVRSQAKRWGVGFRATRLATKPNPGASVEAWARRERYRALASMAQAAGCNLVMLAQHRRDQAETWLLQALRGAGPRGLSAMPALAQRNELTWARPWLDLPRAAIETYVQRHRLRYVDDSSNADLRFARNRLRSQVWPSLQMAFPDVETALSAAARQAQQAAALAHEVATLDLPMVQQGAALAQDAWRALPPARRHNVLRAWLRGLLPGGDVADSLVLRLIDELSTTRSGRWPAATAELRLYKGLLTWHPPAPLARATEALLDAASPVASVGSEQDFSRPGRYPVPAWQGHFEVSATHRGGVARPLLQRVQLQPRQGAEQFSLAPQRPLRSLKKQFQAQAVPTWQRTGPLVWAANGELLFVPGLGINGAHWAAAGQAQLSLRWVPMHSVSSAAG